MRDPVLRGVGIYHTADPASQQAARAMFSRDRQMGNEEAENMILLERPQETLRALFALREVGQGLPDEVAFEAGRRW